jgi:hypothetical protein
VESAAQRRQREAAQARAVEREAEDARAAEINAKIDKWLEWGASVGVLAFFGWVGYQAWAMWRGGA